MNEKIFLIYLLQGQMWKIRREPITVPFLPKDDEQDFKPSLDIFKLVRFFRDRRFKKIQERFNRFCRFEVVNFAFILLSIKILL